MIKIIGVCSNKRNQTAVGKDVGFQFLIFRHQLGLRLKDVARLTDYTVTEIDNFELGNNGTMDLFICLLDLYKKCPECNFRPWSLEIK